MKTPAQVLAVALAGLCSCTQATPPRPSKPALVAPSRKPTQVAPPPKPASSQAQAKSPPLAPQVPPWEQWDRQKSRSVGSVLQGSLVDGVQLPAKAPGLLHNPNKDRARAFGTVPVVLAIIHAGQSLAKRPPSEHLLVNDLSFERGGPITGHASHRAGRDVDFYFPLRSADGAPFPGKLIPLDPKGIGYDYRDLQDPSDDLQVHLDLERTWKVVRALLQNPFAPVQVIYVVAHLQKALADYARAQGEPKALIEQFLSHSCQPGKAPHDDHMHVRFYCSPQDIKAGCEDNAPIHAEQRKRLAKAGVVPKIARPAPRAARKVKTTSAKQARQKAGPLHPSVAAFLDRRKTWTRNIPPGPARCR